MYSRPVEHSTCIYTCQVNHYLPLVCSFCVVAIQGYIATTVQQYLSQYPVDEADIVHVEDGGWVNPDGDFGSPQSLNWNWPLIPNNAQVRGRNWYVATYRSAILSRSLFTCVV